MASKFNEGEKLFFTGTNPDQSCIVLSKTVDAGGVAGEKNAMITVQLVQTGYVMTFPVGLEDSLLKRIKHGVPVGDTPTDPTFGEDDKQTVIL